MICKNCNREMIHVTRYGYYGTLHFYRCPNCHIETNKTPLLSFRKTNRENIRKGSDNYCTVRT